MNCTCGAAVINGHHCDAGHLQMREGRGTLEDVLQMNSADPPLPVATDGEIDGGMQMLGYVVLGVAALFAAAVAVAIWKAWP